MGISKVLHSLTALRWLWEHGREYSLWMHESPRTIEDRWVYLDGHMRIFPFGVNDYRLRRQVRDGNRWAWLLLHFHRSDLLAAVYFVATMVFVNLKAPPFAEAWIVVGFVYMVVNLVIALESSLAFAQTGSYVTGYQWTSYDVKRSRRTVELGTFARLLTRSLFVPTAACAAVTSWFQGVRGLGEWYDPFYFVLTTFVTVGDSNMAPVNGWGKALVCLIMLQSATILAVVVSSVLSTGTD